MRIARVTRIPRHHTPVAGLRSWELAEKIIHAASITILFLFLAEALALIVALRPSKFFRSPFYVLDIFVVSASIAFDFTDNHHKEVKSLGQRGEGEPGPNLTSCLLRAPLWLRIAKAGLLILPRLWRCARVVHGVYMASHMEVRVCV